MKVESLNTYKKGFALVKSVLIVVIICSFGFSGFIYFLNKQEIKELRNLVYVVNKSGDTQVAEAVSKEEVRQIQYEAAAKTAYTFWYQINEGNFEKNVESALWYFGECGKKMLKQYQDDRVGYNLKEKNLNITVEILEVKIDMTKKIGMIKGIQTFTRNNGQRKRNMYVAFTISNVTPSRKNPFGAKMDNWEEFDRSEIVE